MASANKDKKWKKEVANDGLTANQGVQERRSIICNLYNFDAAGCRYEREGGCKKLHACSYCAEKGFLNKHKALECRK